MQQEAKGGHPNLQWTSAARKGGAAQLPRPLPAPSSCSSVVLSATVTARATPTSVVTMFAHFIVFMVIFTSTNHLPYSQITIVFKIPTCCLLKK